MIFSSLQYLIFLPIVAVLYWQMRGTARLALVVVASYIFYMSWLPIYGILLFAMSTLNWLLGLSMELSRAKGHKEWLKPLLVLGLVGNLGSLCYYKYTNFLLSNLIGAANGVFHLFKPAAPVLLPPWSAVDILLPLGISFFVFEFVHYIVDVYRGSPASKSLLEFFAFASFFPSQIAGPIKRYQDFLESLRNPMPWSTELLNEGGALIMQGLFKKVAIADPISIIVGPCFTAGHILTAPDAFLASLGFAIQVYCDFSGYTDMGRGSALLLGIRLPENFALPFLAPDLGDFWRRWHMSLSFWLRDYVYIPLGGSRVSKLMNWRNLFITMVACGLWHGAAWHYVIFGCIQGVGLVIHAEWRAFTKTIPSLDAFGSTWLGKQLSVLTTFIFIVATYTIFRAPDMPTAMSVVGSWFAPDTSCTLIEPIFKAGLPCLVSVYFGFWLIADALKRNIDFTQGAFRLFASPMRYASWTAAVFLIVAARPTVATPFVYFQF